MKKKKSKNVGFDWDCVYRCCNCHTEFVVKDGEEYQDDPATRVSPCCGTNPVAFLRTVGGNRASYISDEMIGGMLCPADGKTYDSKSSYYKAVKAAGCEIVGNDPIKPSKPQGESIDWKRAVYESIQQLS